jgi:hypothetical protein
LERAGLVIKETHGRERLVRANPVVIRQASALLDAYERIWQSRIDRLDALLASNDPDDDSPPRAGRPQARKD